MFLKGKQSFEYLSWAILTIVFRREKENVSRRNLQQYLMLIKQLHFVCPWSWTESAPGCIVFYILRCSSSLAWPWSPGAMPLALSQSLNSTTDLRLPTNHWPMESTGPQCGWEGRGQGLWPGTPQQSDVDSVVLLKTLHFVSTGMAYHRLLCLKRISGSIVWISSLFLLCATLFLASTAVNITSTQLHLEWTNSLSSYWYVNNQNSAFHHEQGP